MITPPFFSIIIPTFNRASLLKIAVDSVLSQTFNDWELIIVDDGSTDGTKKIIEEYLKGIGFRVKEKSQSHQVTKSQEKTGEAVTWCRGDICIRYFYQENKGPAAARNRGLKETKGEYICFLDSDDRFVMRKLEVTYEYIKKYPQFKVFHTEEIWYSAGRLLPQKKIHQKPDGNVFGRALKICCISISTACIHRSVFEDRGSFDENMPVCEDYDFWLRVTLKYPVKLIPQYLTIKEGGRDDQQSKRYPALDKYRIYAITKLLEENDLPPDSYRMAVEELKKKCAIYVKGANKRGKHQEAQKYTILLKKFSNSS